MPITRYLSIPDAIQELNLDPLLASPLGADPTITKLKIAFDQLYNRANRPVKGEDIAGNAAALADIKATLDGLEAISLVAHHWFDEGSKVLTEIGLFSVPAPVAPVETTTAP